ncbi:MAG TPA: hypothetical protein VFM29_03625 [Vicinamibacteria bacterium]|nr:hypothetical protein [Vicinamibacteria bacterium]
MRSRETAGRDLAARVARLVRGPAVVVALPAHATPVAVFTAEALQAPLVPSYAHAMTVPYLPDVAFGAVDDSGEAVLNTRVVEGLRLSPEEIAAGRERARIELERRRDAVGAAGMGSWVRDRTVVVVCDQLEAVLAVEAVVAHARRLGAAAVMVAAACARAGVADALSHEVDAFVAGGLETEPHRCFPAVSDAEIVELLGRAASSFPR